MAAVKLIILLGLFAVALGFTVPESDLDDPSNYNELAFEEQLPLEGSEIRIRNPRSPQGTLGGGVEHSSRDGTSAHLNYNHQITRNLEAYGEASRNFRYNDNSGMVGVRYRF